MTLKTENGQFLTVLNQVVLQDIKTFFEDAHLNAQFYWISSVTMWNFTTVITLMLVNKQSLVKMYQSPVYKTELKTDLPWPWWELGFLLEEAE